MEYYGAYYMIGGGLHTLGKLILVLACGILWTKQRDISTWLMFFGGILTIIFSVFTLLLPTFFLLDGPESIAKFNAIGRVLDPLPYILFAIGLLLFAAKYLKSRS